MLPTSILRAVDLLSIFLFAYIGTYAGFSLNGAYMDNVSALAEIGPMCLCISDLNEWQAAYVIAAHETGSKRVGRAYSANAAGYFFLPLVVIDQRYWHVTQPRGAKAAIE